MNFKAVIGKLINGGKLTTPEAYSLMTSIGEGEFNDAQTVAIIIGLSSRDAALEEIIGFREALLDLSLPTNLDQYDAIDLCGTGGDEKNTFNISTLAAFIVAGSGYKVAKHGNYGVSSVSGSSNILEKLGYNFSTDSSKLDSELNEFNICFLHAPLFHPALKNVATVRKQLGVKTIFNTLGPLVNPARTKKQLVGVYNMKLARLYHYMLQQDSKDYAVVHSIDGYDEISLTANIQYFSSQGEFLFTPDDFGMKWVSPTDLFGGNDMDEAMAIFLDVIQNEGSDAQTNVVSVNAATAIQCFEKKKSLHECIEIAKETLARGEAFNVLKNVLKTQ